MVSPSVVGQAPVAAPFRMRTILLPLVAIVLGTFMAILDSTVVNVALPTLERVFTTDLHSIQWVLTGYLLAQAAVIPLSGWMADRFGAKRIYLLAIMLFTLGSALCAAAPSSGLLIGFRVLQGLGGGMLMPIGLSFIYRLAPPDQRGLVMSFFGVPILLAPALGPVLSGYLVQYADWRWIFLINVPTGLITLAFGARALPNMPAQRVAGALDTIGMILGPLGFAALSYGIGVSATDGWAGAQTVAALAVGAAALITFVLRELSTPAPLLELRVFRSRDFSLAIVMQWVGQAALFGALFLIPLFFQQVRGYGPLDTGLFLLPQAIAAAVFMPIGGRLFDRLGPRVPVVVGVVMLALSTWFLAQITATTTGEDLRWVLTLRGAGMGLMLMPINTQTLDSAPRHLVSRVTSLTGALQNVASSLAIAALSTILADQSASNAATVRATIAAYGRAAVQRAVAAHQATVTASGHVVVPPAVQAGIHRYAAAAQRSAAAGAFDTTFLVASGVAAAGVALALTLRRRPAAATSGDVAEAPTEVAPRRSLASSA